jgi:DNA-binding XRE family transcriptional regulator
MSVVAKTPPMFNLKFKGNTPVRILRDVRTRYAKYLLKDENDLVEWKKTDLHKEISSRMSPGEQLLEFRTIRGLTQQALGAKIGATPQRIYEFETGRRGIPKTIAKKLAEIFGVAPSLFI